MSDRVFAAQPGRRVASGLAGVGGWGLIRLELAAWRRAGRAPLFWWRDDDARHPSPALARLLRLSASTGAPLALAVIPDADPSSLFASLAEAASVQVIQHGCDHVDRNLAGGFSAEFGTDQPVADVAAAVTAAWERLSRALPARPVYAPPWNQLTSNLARALPATPLRAVSTYGGDATPVGRLARVNAHIDVMKWRPPRFRGDGALLLRLWRQLRARRRGRRWDEPIGWLTHHAKLDEEAWRFLETLLRRLGPDCRDVAWRSIGELAGLEPA